MTPENQLKQEVKKAFIQGVIITIGIVILIVSLVKQYS